jgi:hypothetical protein
MIILLQRTVSARVLRDPVTAHVLSLYVNWKSLTLVSIIFGLLKFIDLKRRYT